jgi:hypothetical protein
MSGLCNEGRGGVGVCRGVAYRDCGCGTKADLTRFLRVYAPSVQQAKTNQDTIPTISFFQGCIVPLLDADETYVPDTGKIPDTQSYHADLKCSSDPTCIPETCLGSEVPLSNHVQLSTSAGDTECAPAPQVRTPSMPAQAVTGASQSSESTEQLMDRLFFEPMTGSDVSGRKRKWDDRCNSTNAGVVGEDGLLHAQSISRSCQTYVTGDFTLYSANIYTGN